MLMKHKIQFGLLCAMSFLFVSLAGAFSISPLKYMVSLDPGDSHDVVVVVKNDSSTDKEYQAVVMGVQQDAHGRPIFKTNSDIAEDWIKFKDEKILLKRNENKDLVFIINVPKNIPPGAHYIGLGVQEKNDQSVSGQLMTIVTLQVAGTATESLVLENFYPVKKYFFNKNLSYFLQVKNVGNIDLSMKAKIQTYDFKNKNLGFSTVSLGNKLFSQSNRSAEINPPVNSEIFWPGLYRSTVTINYGATDQQIVSGASFWYWPAWFLCLVVGTIILILLFVVYFKKKHARI